ncbi:MAG: anthranilate synthase component I family protein [Candidatus Hadarchaeota archaeon]
MMLGYDDAKAMARERPCILPLVMTTEGCANPANVYFSLRRRGEPSFLLESAVGPGEAARYSVIGCNPLLYLRVRGGAVSMRGKKDYTEFAGGLVKTKDKRDALRVLEKVMACGKIHVPPIAARYMLSLTGYISYDYVRTLAKIGDNSIDDLHHPEIEFMLPEHLMVFDHFSKLTHYCSVISLLDGDFNREYERAREGVRQLSKITERKPSPAKPKITSSSNMSQAEFESIVTRAKRYIRDGDVIQAVLSRRIELSPPPPAELFYTNLRRINPSPYMFFLDFPDRSVIGSSPEILVRVEGRKVETRPIAGTRRRGRAPADERRMEKELLADEKERAEHLMLVDLGRNDIGRVSDLGSVKVNEFMKVEKYSHVQHLVSNVVGRLRDGMGVFDALRATFPAGTVTGAPKVRAMEIIEELEPTRRGIYAGAVGSFSCTGDADLAITIRTLVAERNRGYIQVGAGVVADSDPRKEHYETENKARALLAAAGV